MEPTSPNVMEPIEDPDAADLQDEPIHDQLPSVEEAKANVELEGESATATRRSRCRFCFYIMCCICSSFILLLMLIIILPRLIGSSGQSTGNSMTSGPKTLPPGAFESRVDYVREFLDGFSDPSELNRPGSAQHRASKWIADEDVLHLPIDDPTFVERYALAVFYYATGGPNWPLHLGFLTERSTCDWFHIGFGSDDKPRHVGANCQEGMKVQQLFFPEKWLNGEFPDELSLLDDLRYISIYRNPGIGGAFPPVMQKMTNLEYLAMHFCDMEGAIPSWIGEMTSLTSLVLSNNDLTGTMPNSIGRLTGLTQLFLDDNSIEGDIKQLGNLYNLKALLLEDNQFYGGLDEPMMAAWQHMEIIDLSNNNLTSTLPAGLFYLKNLSVADFHSNQMTGAFPALDTHNEALRFLALHENNFQGQIPDSIDSLRKLTHLDMSNNLFTGTIPHSFGNITKLKYFFLSMNAFSNGKIPNFLQKMSKLQDLSLKSNGLTGIIPHWLGTMSSLILLDLDTNELQGTIPRVLGDLSNLKFLLLNRNQLVGSIPNSFGKLSKLDFLLLERNNLNGTAKHICDRADKPQVFMADCAEVGCPCCSACCMDDETFEHCDDQVWLGGVDPIWETKYERAFYQFEKVKLKRKTDP